MYLDESTLDAIESDLAAAHESLAHGDLSFSAKGTGKLLRRGIEIVGAAGAFSYANARASGGELRLGPVPVDLGVGVALALMSLFDIGGKYTDDLLNVGLGAASAWAARTGAAFGAANTPLQKSSGMPQMAGAGVGVDIAGALPHSSPIPAGTQRFMVTQL